MTQRRKKYIVHYSIVYILLSRSFCTICFALLLNRWKVYDTFRDSKYRNNSGYEVIIPLEAGILF